jgi:hypothetical protein
MARLVNRFTGSTVNVPEEKVEGLRARGFDLEDEKSAAPAKQADAKKSSK